MGGRYELDLGTALDDVASPVLEVWHGLGSEEVTVETLNGDREPVGHLVSVPIDRDSVEVVPSPGTRFVVVTLDDVNPRTPGA